MSAFQLYRNDSNDVSNNTSVRRNKDKSIHKSILMELGFHLWKFNKTMGDTASCCTGVQSNSSSNEETVPRIRHNSQVCIIHHCGHYIQF